MHFFIVYVIEDNKFFDDKILIESQFFRTKDIMFFLTIYVLAGVVRKELKLKTSMVTLKNNYLNIKSPFSGQGFFKLFYN